MDDKYIALTDCVKGGIYLVHSRNLSFAVYNGNGGFIGIRSKFESEYLFTEYHWDQGPPFGTVMPQKLLGMLPDGIPVNENLTHDKGSSWATFEGAPRPSVRHDLRPGEAPHGKRRGFVDEWADTGERLPDDTYPYYMGNEALFNALREAGKKYQDNFPAHSGQG